MNLKKKRPYSLKEAPFVLNSWPWDVPSTVNATLRMVIVFYTVSNGLKMPA